MAKTEITKLSSRGQVVIPKEFRKDLEEGTPFLVTRDNDTILLKKVDVDKEWEEFERIVKKIRDRVKKVGIKPSDVPKMIKKFREEQAREKK